MRGYKEIINATLYKFNLLLVRPFPRGFQKRALRGKNLIGVEIGVFKGEHAYSLLKRNSIRKLYLVDPYEAYGKYPSHIKEELIKANKICKGKLTKFKNKIVRIKKKAEDAVKDIPNNLDFVYIDGNHVYEYVKQDIENYYSKLKKGGILAGDDFDCHFPIEHQVIEAVTEFAVKNNLKLYVDNSDWWIYKGRTLKNVQKII